MMQRSKRLEENYSDQLRFFYINVILPRAKIDAAELTEAQQFVDFFEEPHSSWGDEFPLRRWLCLAVAI
ncbi:MAG: hypothetical protein ACFCU1_14570 [Sumerlaeia bacterium]